MNIYDKAAWHIDEGQNESEVVTRFSIIFDFLNEHNMLNSDGIELMDIGIDESISLHEGLLTDEGNAFIEKYYDSLLPLKTDELKSELLRLANIKSI